MIGSTPMLLGHYRPLDSFLHRLDARSKLAPVLVVMILGLLTDSLLFYVIVLAGLVGGLLASGVTNAGLADMISRAFIAPPASARRRCSVQPVR